MFNFFKNNKNYINENQEILKTAALLVHAAKIDENYSNKEKEIIKKALSELFSEEKNIDEVIKEAENIESNSNQILNFTKEIKNLNEERKKKIIETLWKIIYSDSLSDIYEANLMRRLTGLLYLDSKVVGDIKKKSYIKFKKMTYIVNENCIKCKLMDCVEVCPVDCFYEGKNMLVIKPDECIDCGVCEPECPVDAIVPDTESGNEKWLELNKKYSDIWPNISVKKEPPKDNEKFKNEKNKFKKYFKENI